MKRGVFRWSIMVFVVVFAIVLFSPLASSRPDGLERVAEDHGFIGSAREAPFELLPDYTIPGVANGGLSTIAAGMIGILVVFGVGFGAGRGIDMWKSRRGKRGKTQQ